MSFFGLFFFKLNLLFLLVSCSKLHLFWVNWRNTQLAGGLFYILTGSSFKRSVCQSVFSSRHKNCFSMLFVWIHCMSATCNALSSWLEMNCNYFCFLISLSLFRLWYFGSLKSIFCGITSVLYFYCTSMWICLNLSLRKQSVFCRTANYETSRPTCMRVDNPGLPNAKCFVWKNEIYSTALSIYFVI